MNRSTFINPGLSLEHRGAERLQAAGAIALRLGRQFKGAKGMVALLLAGALSALVVLADQIVSTWTDGHLLMAWSVLWALVFLALALFAEATRGWTARVVAAWRAYSRAAARRAEDERMWAMAQSDPRLMLDIDAARLRNQRDRRNAGGDGFYGWPTARDAKWQAPAHNWN